MEYAEGNDETPTNDYTLTIFLERRPWHVGYNHGYSDLHGWASLEIFVDEIIKGTQSPPSSVFFNTWGAEQVQWQPRWSKLLAILNKHWSIISSKLKKLELHRCFEMERRRRLNDESGSPSMLFDLIQQCQQLEELAIRSLSPLETEEFGRLFARSIPDNVQSVYLFLGNLEDVSIEDLPGGPAVAASLHTFFQRARRLENLVLYANCSLDSCTKETWAPLSKFAKFKVDVDGCPGSLDAAGFIGDILFPSTKPNAQDITMEFQHIPPGVPPLDRTGWIRISSGDAYSITVTPMESDDSAKVFGFFEQVFAESRQAPTVLHISLPTLFGKKGWEDFWKTVHDRQCVKYLHLAPGVRSVDDAQWAERPALEVLNREFSCMIRAMTPYLSSIKYLRSFSLRWNDALGFALGFNVLDALEANETVQDIDIKPSRYNYDDFEFPERESFRCIPNLRRKGEFIAGRNRINSLALSTEPLSLFGKVLCHHANKAAHLRMGIKVIENAFSTERKFGNLEEYDVQDIQSVTMNSLALQPTFIFLSIQRCVTRLQKNTEEEKSAATIPKDDARTLLDGILKNLSPTTWWEHAGQLLGQLSTSARSRGTGTASKKRALEKKEPFETNDQDGDRDSSVTKRVRLG